MKHLVSLLIVLLAIVFTLLTRQLIPEKSFDSYFLSLDSCWSKEPNEQIYFADINQDSTTEEFVHHNINMSGHSIELKHNGKLNEIFIFRDQEMCISSSFHFADVNNDHYLELLFISVNNDSAYLNIMEYRAQTKLLYPKEKIGIDAVKHYGGKPDVANNFILTNGSDIYFDLQGGYTVQPRNIYKYDLNGKSLTRTKLNGLVNPQALITNYHRKDYLLCSYVKATSNTLSPRDAKTLRNSTNKDTLEIYKSIKHLEYEYGDFSSYILLYDDQLRFAFEPIEFFGWTNFTKAAIIQADSLPLIIGFTNAQLTEPDNQKCKLMTVCGMDGKIIKQQPLKHNYTDLFSYKDKAVLVGEKSLFEYNAQLDEIRTIPNITAGCGFFNLQLTDDDQFIAFNNNKLEILSAGDLSTMATFTIEQEYTPYPVENRITLIRDKDKTAFIFSSKLFYYQFSISSNRYVWFKYPAYLLIFIFWILILFGMVRVNSRRLEHEKQKLEKIIEDRTHELAEKNKELERQKDEIHQQASQLATQNKHLEDLDQFKRTFIGTVVHDLKNPLGQIITNTGDKIIRHLAGRMLLLVTNLLDVEKYDEAQIHINKELHSLNEILNQAVDNFDISLKEKNLNITIQTKDIIVHADRDLMIRVMENLLSNAIRFSSLNDTIEIIATMQTNNTALVSISNHGSHIPEEELELIFDKYRQAQVIHPSGYRSTGLGLTFCKMIVEAHGYSIKAENQSGGVRFSFNLEAELTSEQQLSLEKKTVELPPFSADEIMQLKSVVILLKNKEIYQVSEIVAVLNELPDTDEHIRKFKNEIIDAVFNSNASLYRQLLDSVIS